MPVSKKSQSDLITIPLKTSFLRVREDKKETLVMEHTCYGEVSADALVACFAPAFEEDAHRRGLQPYADILGDDPPHYPQK